MVVIIVIVAPAAVVVVLVATAVVAPNNVQPVSFQNKNLFKAKEFMNYTEIAIVVKELSLTNTL